jgi:hypothetical protein
MFIGRGEMKFCLSLLLSNAIPHASLIYFMPNPRSRAQAELQFSFTSGNFLAAP